MPDTICFGASGTRRGYEELLADAVRVLTAAARSTVTLGGVDGAGGGQPADFAAFLTHAVAGAAANLGGTERLLAGRPGSWEAEKVRDMLYSTVGYDEAYLWAYRTEPVIVRVHVQDVLTDLGVGQLYEEAFEELDRRGDALLTRAGPIMDERVEAALDELDRLREALGTQQRREWAGYGEAFAGQVLRAAAEQLPALVGSVRVVIGLQWQPGTDSGAEFGTPECLLWEAARQATPLPGSGIPPRDYPPGADIAQVDRAAGRDPPGPTRDRAGAPVNTPADGPLPRPPAGGDGPEPASAAALAGLAREVEGLRRSVQALQQLPGRVEELAGMVARLADKLTTQNATGQRITTWLRHDPTEADAEQLLVGLAEWLHEVFLRYGDGARALPDCWAWHPDLVEELLWLRAAWLAAYDDPAARISAAADWHDRLRPGVVRRIREVYARSCSIENHTPGRDRAVPAAAVPLPAALPVIADWWTHRRDQAPPAPTNEHLAAERPYRHAGSRSRA